MVASLVRLLHVLPLRCVQRTRRLLKQLAGHAVKQQSWLHAVEPECTSGSSGNGSSLSAGEAMAGAGSASPKESQGQGPAEQGEELTVSAVWSVCEGPS